VKRRRFIALVGGAMTLPFIARAQQRHKNFRIGYLTASGPGQQFDRMKSILAEFGYVEGSNTEFEARFSNGQFDRMAVLADDLARSQVDIIIAQSTPAALAAKKVTSTIPIVVTSSGDAVGSGLVASLARPGGNVTGMSFLGTEIAAKQIQLIKEVLPYASRIAFIANGALRPEQLFFEQMKNAAAGLSVSIAFIDTRHPDDFERASAEMTRLSAEAAVVAPGGNYFDQRARLLRLIVQKAMPALFFQREYVEDGGLMSYGPSYMALFRGAAAYVDRILKGEKPANLPIQQPTTFELVINLKAAKALGRDIPTSILLRADEVIE